MKRMVLITLILFFMGSFLGGAENQPGRPDPNPSPSSEECAGLVRGPELGSLPDTKNCAVCHNVPGIYEELSGSSHESMSCLECHVPGKAQQNKYEAEERSFYRLGYYEGHEKWMETSGNDVCLRCHADRETGTMNKNCWECHMRINGTDEFVLVTDKKLPPIGDNIRVKKVFPHRSHTFRMHPEA